MRTDINTLIEQQPRQHSAEWYKNRLGNFTGSEVGRLMKKGRGKDAEWSEDAMTYIKEIVAERLINPVIMDVPELFDQFLDYSVSSSKATAWGNNNEEKALKAYTAITGHEVTKCGSLPNERVGSFWDSPDGLLLDVDGVVEVKSPATIKTHAEYVLNIHKGEDMLKLKKNGNEYFWQVVAHFANTGAKFCDWMSYCPFLKPSLHIVTIDRDEDIIAQLLERVEKAEEIAKNMLLEMQYKMAV